MHVQHHIPFMHHTTPSHPVSAYRLLGLTKGWKRLYCTLVPFHFHVGAPATEVQLVMIDETTLSLVDRLWVTNAKGITCPTRARLHIDLVSYLPCCLHRIRALMMVMIKTPASQGQRVWSKSELARQSIRTSEHQNIRVSEQCLRHCVVSAIHFCHLTILDIRKAFLIQTHHDISVIVTNAGETLRSTKAGCMLNPVSHVCCHKYNVQRHRLKG